MHFLLWCNTEVLYVEIDQELKGILAFIPASACENIYEKGTTVEIDLEVCVPGA